MPYSGIYYGLHVSQARQCVFDKCLTVDEWINLVNSSNVITKGKARLNMNSMLNGRDRHHKPSPRGRLTVLTSSTRLQHIKER